MCPGPTNYLSLVDGRHFEFSVVLKRLLFIIYETRYLSDKLKIEMPSSCCSVPNCHNRGGHQYPSDSKLREKWIIAIRRLDGTTMKTWTPSKSAVVCKSHFTSSDYVKETIYGMLSVNSYLSNIIMIKWIQVGFGSII